LHRLAQSTLPCQQFSLTAGTTSGASASHSQHACGFVAHLGTGYVTFAALLRCTAYLQHPKAAGRCVARASTEMI
jgi:hypothetical protein